MKLSKQRLTKNEIHLWLHEFGEDLRIEQKRISRKEWEILKKIKNHKMQLKQYASYSFLRLTLSLYTGSKPELIPIVRSKKSRPYLKSRDLFFSVSHSANLVLVAVSQSKSLGVDIEKFNPNLDVTEFIRDALTDLEISQLPNPPTSASFHEIWVLKEAYLKAIGKGLTKSLHSFNVERKATTWILSEKNGKKIEDWTLEQFSKAKDISIGLAYKGTKKVRLLNTIS